MLLITVTLYIISSELTYTYMALYDLYGLISSST